MNSSASLKKADFEPSSGIRLISPSFAADPDVQPFVGRLDERPVATSIAIRSGDASGVYNVGTLPEPDDAASGARLPGPQSEPE